ncbi:MAG: class I lanthipeptide [Chitinophaga sp.]|uniref:class I lanthipeptide n=1 Tax=Chitinophaga sp. TaxID=1869181 RepID=UPI0025B8F3E9|nr:class I lanthipeptide [Chitinophaga sp.]MBV8253381.1 class I lanthipeptide [Chitinophaga sp.]
MKKKITLEKKLAFNKTTIAYLNASQQSQIGGGLQPVTKQIICAGPTRQLTCETIADPADTICIICY